MKAMAVVEDHSTFPADAFQMVTRTVLIPNGFGDLVFTSLPSLSHAGVVPASLDLGDAVE
jgi:hypothetical protein